MSPTSVQPITCHTSTKHKISGKFQRYTAPSYTAAPRPLQSRGCNAGRGEQQLATVQNGTAPYTGTVRVDVGDAVEQLIVPLLAANSKLRVTTLQFPLGLVLEEADGLVKVTEVQAGSHAADAKVEIGDVLRATTAAMMQMTYPTMNLMFGGVGRPKLKRVLIPTSGRPFAAVSEAIRSNRELPGGTVTLVLERLGQDEPQASTPAEWTSVFDPKIFE